MKNVSHKNIYHTDEVEIHVDPSTIILIRSNIEVRPERVDVKIKLCMSHTSEKLYMYKLKSLCLTMKSRGISFVIKNLKT